MYNETFWQEVRDGTISVVNEIVDRLGKIRNLKCYIQHGRGIWITSEIFSKECEFEMEISRNENETKFKLSEKILQKEGIDEETMVSIEYREFAFAKPAIIIKSVC